MLRELRMNKTELYTALAKKTDLRKRGLIISAYALKMPLIMIYLTPLV